ncbi:hypothetical protein GNI_178860 [Gregarina niphandrodes]|uniref:Uncharacterized protein n=1 Tax=Gregarina niphandrodes TaxID=110365 RepID=A0A023AX03_GRENI|nr:hypothetical protein GNI_178860 [Gregarina niphandrodes]EZG43271.1 hypothetical protein GNI_178860 [Gregarina niphandrodes]|eukprot:XP_011133473.1 hypothetical protein GNI_178860 [Gregarina niphandrodes]
MGTDFLSCGSIARLFFGRISWGVLRSLNIHQLLCGYRELMRQSPPCRRRPLTLWICLVQGVSGGSPSEQAVDSPRVTNTRICVSRSPKMTRKEGSSVGKDYWNWSCVTKKNYESHWTSRFWIPLDETGFELLRSVAATKPYYRRGIWTRRGAAFVDFIRRSGGHSWALTTGTETIRPNYIPVLSRSRRLTKPAESGKVLSDFEAYQVLHGSLSSDEWMRLTSIDESSFERCALAYVELGTIISSYFTEPYGLVDTSIQDAIANLMSSREAGNIKYRRRMWTVGCLLQHSGALTERLAEFCIKKLGYSPPHRRSTLQCLKEYPRESLSERDTSSKMYLLKQTLSGLPVVSAKEFAKLTQSEMEDHGICDRRCVAEKASAVPLGQSWGKSWTKSHVTAAEPVQGTGVVDGTLRKRNPSEEHFRMVKKKATESQTGMLRCNARRFDKLCLQPTNTLQRLERLVNNHPESAVSAGFVDTFAEVVWKEYGPLLSPPLDRCLMDNHLTN